MYASFGALTRDVYCVLLISKDLRSDRSSPVEIIRKLPAPDDDDDDETTLGATLMGMDCVKENASDDDASNTDDRATIESFIVSKVIVSRVVVVFFLG